jgi:TRAP-type mannitol/chloroaromatic compound transport system substrate-binding protein
MASFARLAVVLALFTAACTGDAVTSTEDASDSAGAEADEADAGGDEDADEGVELTQGETFEFTVQTGVPATSVYHGLIVEWGERIDTMSAGRLKADVVPSGAIVGALEILDAVDDGTMEAGFAWSNYRNGKNKAAALFSNPPAGSTGMDQSTSLAWMYDGGGLELYAELYQSEIGVDVIPLPVAPMGPDPFGWFKTVITSVDDVQGLKYRSPPGLPGDSFNELGMEAIAMPGSEIIPAANSGLIEGAEWISPSDDTALGFQDVWDNYYLQGIHQSTDIGELLLNKARFEGRDCPLVD